MAQKEAYSRPPTMGATNPTTVEWNELLPLPNTAMATLLQKEVAIEHNNPEVVVGNAPKVLHARRAPRYSPAESFNGERTLSFRQSEAQRVWVQP